MLIPHHLKDNVKVVKDNRDYVILSFICNCKNESFIPSINEQTKSSINTKKDWNDVMKHRFSKGNVYQYSDKEGNVFIERKNLIGKIVDKEDLTNMPDLNEIKIVKLKCKNCGNEYIIFDNRVHGFDAKIRKEKKLLDYEKIRFVEGTKKEFSTIYKIIIHLINDQEYEDHMSKSNLSTEEYSEMFHSITIYIVNDSGKKKVFFSEETA